MSHVSASASASGPAYVSVFVFVSGRPSLDFAGTRKWRRSPQPEEQLDRAPDLSRWASEAGLIDKPIKLDAARFAEGIALREAIYAIVDALLDGNRPPPGAVRLVNSTAAGARLQPRLRHDGTVTIQGTANQLFATLAADLLDLLRSPERDRVKRCGNPRCTRIFVDASRLGNRVWCGMAECGNRAKVQAFRQRHQPGVRTGVAG